MRVSKKNRRKGILLAALTLLFSVGGVSAYMTDQEAAANEFTVGDLDFNLYETAWDGELPDGTYNATPSSAMGIEQARNIVPGQVIPKDPAIRNNSRNDAYLRVRVKIPVEDAVLADGEGNLLNGGAPTETELFSYEENAGTGMRLITDSPTVEVDTATASNASGTSRYHVYEYMYTGGGEEEIPLPAGQDIPPLFDEVVFANLADSSLNGTVEWIHVDFHAIQSAGFASAEDAWNAYDRQNLQG